MRRRLNARRRRTLDGPSLPGCRGCGARRRRFCGAAVGGYSPSTLGPIRLPGNEWACTTKLARRSWTFRRLTSAIGLHYKTVRWAWSVKILVTLPPLPTLHVPYEMFKFSVCKAPCVARWQVIALWLLRCPQLWIFFLPPPDGLSGRTGVSSFPRELVDSSALSSAVQAGFSGLAAWACLWALPPALTQRLDSLAAGGRPHGHSRPLTGSLRDSGSG